MDADSALAPIRNAAASQSDEAQSSKKIMSIENYVSNKAVSKAISHISDPLVFATGPGVPQQLQDKFLTARMPDMGQPEQPSEELLTELIDHIETELHKLPSMRMAGPNGTVFEHIGMNFPVPGAARVFAKVLALLPSGYAPAEATRVHRSARVSAPHKRNSAGELITDIRPLAAGSAMWRVAMRGWAKMFAEEAADAVGDSQYGIRRPGSVTALRTDLLIEWMMNPDKALIGVDLVNMHCRVRGQYLQHVIPHKVPRMSSMLAWLRIPRTHVYVDEYGAAHTIDAADGLDQGCPASNRLAPIAIADAHQQLSEQGRVFGLQDDTYILADRSLVPPICDNLRDIFAPSGTEVNFSKSFVVSRLPCSAGTSGISVSNCSPTVLKLPLPMPGSSGEIQFDQSPSVKAIETRTQLLDRILNLKQHGLKSQTALLLARVATSGDANYIAQNIPISTSTAEALDHGLFSGVLDILNIDPEDASAGRMRWFLPFRDGGMGLQSVKHSADGLLLATWLSGLSRATERFNEASIASLLERLPAATDLVTTISQRLHDERSFITSLDDALSFSSCRSLAKDLRLAACTRTRQSFMSGADSENQVACNESGGKGAGAWLMTPSKPEHKFTNQAFVSLVRLRMHLPVYASEGLCLHRSKRRGHIPPSQCSCTRDRFGRHVLLCQTGGAIVERHDKCRDKLAEVIVEQSALPAPTEEQVYVYTDNRHPDIRYQNWRGDEVYIDVAIVSPHGRAEPARTRPGAAIAAAENCKRLKYSQLNLMPAVAAHLGRPGASLVTLIRSLCRDPDAEARSETISTIWQDWACTLQQWNANILATAGPLLPP